MELHRATMKISAAKGLAIAGPIPLVPQGLSTIPTLPAHSEQAVTENLTQFPRLAH